MANFNSPQRLAEMAKSAEWRRARKKNRLTKQLLKPEVRAKAMAGLRRARFYQVKILNEKQHKAIALLADFINCWGPEYICGQAGINLATLYNWRNDPFFIKELDKEITRRRSMFRLEAHRQLFKRIKKGNPRLLLSYLKMTGDFKEQVEITEKTTDDKNETELDNEIQELQDELGITSRE
jgi:hypothetical protein